MLSEFIITVAGASIAFLIVGFLTPKITLYGGLATCGITLAYLAIPGLSASSVIDTMLPLWIDFWTLYPSLVEMMLTTGQAEDSLVGTAINGITIIALGFPYIVGIYLGATKYPEFLPIKVIL